MGEPSTELAESDLTIEGSLPTHAQYLAWSGLYPISLGGAMSIPGVLQANSIITDLGSQIDLSQEKRLVDTSDATTRWERVPSPSPIIRRPNAEEPIEETMRAILAGLAGEGEVFLYPTLRDPVSNRPYSFTVIPHHEMKLTRAPDGIHTRYEWRSKELKLWRDVYHLTYFKIPGQMRGIGPIQAYAKTLAGSDVVEEWARSYFTAGGQSTTHLHAQDELDPADAARLSADWVASRGGLLSPAVTSGDVTVTQEMIDADKVQALDTRKWNLQSIASMYRLNPYLLAVAMSGSSITYQTLPDLAAEAIRLTIYPAYLRKIETVFTEMLPHGHRARFVLRDFLRADEGTRMTTAATAIDAGVLTPDEVRADEGRKPLNQETKIHEPV